MFTKSLFPSIIFSILPKIRKKCKGLPKKFLKYFRLSQKLLLTKRPKNTKVLLSKANGKILKPFRFFNRPIAPGIALRSTAPLGSVLSGRFFICRISFGLPQVFHKFSTNFPQRVFLFFHKTAFRKKTQKRLIFYEVFPKLHDVRFRLQTDKIFPTPNG